MLKIAARLCIYISTKARAEYGTRKTTGWCNLKAWHSLASVLSLARKGDSVFAIGRLDKREHNGKTYTNLVAKYLSVASINCAAASSATMKPPEGQFSEPDDDGELPF